MKNNLEKLIKEYLSFPDHTRSNDQEIFNAAPEQLQELLFNTKGFKGGLKNCALHAKNPELRKKIVDLILQKIIPGSSKGHHQEILRWSEYWELYEVWEKMIEHQGAIWVWNEWSFIREFLCRGFSYTSKQKMSVAAFLLRMAKQDSIDSYTEIVFWALCNNMLDDASALQLMDEVSFFENKDLDTEKWNLFSCTARHFLKENKPVLVEKAVECALRDDESKKSTYVLTNLLTPGIEKQQEHIAEILFGGNLTDDELRDIARVTTVSWIKAKAISRIKQSRTASDIAVDILALQKQ